MTARATDMTVGSDKTRFGGVSDRQAGKQTRHEDVMRGAEGEVSRSEYDV